MRISDWSSDVCSSDLLGRIEDAFAARERELAMGRRGARAWVAESRETAQVVLDRLLRPKGRRFDRVRILRFGSRVEIGRASCREGGCRYVLIQVAAGSLKKKQKKQEQGQRE